MNDCIVAVAWEVIGVWNLVDEKISRTQYGLMWIMLMVHLFGN